MFITINNASSLMESISNMKRDTMPKAEVQKYLSFTKVLTDVLMTVKPEAEALQTQLSQELDGVDENDKATIYAIQTKYTPLFEEINQKETTLTLDDVHKFIDSLEYISLEFLSTVDFINNAQTWVIN